MPYGEIGHDSGRVTDAWTAGDLVPLGTVMTDDRTVHDTLAHRAFLHDDPEAYLAGVDDAVAESDERDDEPTEDDASNDGPVAIASRA